MKWLKRLLAAVMLLVAIALFCQTLIRDKILSDNVNANQITQIKSADIAKNSQLPASFDIGAVEVLDTTKVLLDRLKGIQELPTMGGISIPDLSINLPIFRGLDNDNLYYGAGTLFPNQKMGQGNYVLASHHVFGLRGSSQMLFSPLDRAEYGQKMYITDKENVYTYEITSIQRVDPDNSEVLDFAEGSDPMLTLVTCTDMKGTQRIIVQGKLVDTQSYEAQKSMFSMKYNQIFYW